MRHLGVVPLLVAVAGTLVLPGSVPAFQAQSETAAARKEISESARKGMDFLRKSQGPDGAWQRYPGITAICVLGFLRNGVTDKDPVVAKACGYLAGLAKPDGGIYTDQFGPGQRLPTYNTALAMTALHATGNAKYRDTVAKARAYLGEAQLDEGEGFSPKDMQYGGIGYGGRGDGGDLSNLQNALEALAETGEPKDSAVFKKALIFLQRCQNRNESNDQQWAGTDGGFVYRANGESSADENTKQAHSSYGTMTYGGLKSYLYCSVGKNDPRVQSAFNWIRANYDTEQNPRMGDDGLYYYFHTMSKTLSIWGTPSLTDAAGKKHVWAVDLSKSIVKRQKADGSWANTNRRWWEDRPDLATGFALISLGNCNNGL